MTREEIIKKIDELNEIIETDGFIVINADIGAINSIEYPKENSEWMNVISWDYEREEEVRVSDLEAGAFTVYKKQEETK